MAWEFLPSVDEARVALSSPPRVHQAPVSSPRHNQQALTNEDDDLDCVISPLSPSTSTRSHRGSLPASRSSSSSVHTAFSGLYEGFLSSVANHGNTKSSSPSLKELPQHSWLDIDKGSVGELNFCRTKWSAATSAKEKISRAFQSDSKGPEKQETWHPVWLSTPVLLGFALVFATLLFALAMLQHFSNLNSGLTKQETKNRLLWKFGPTAFLLVIAALWNQVAHANKILAPWKELQEGPSSAQKTLLLDYVSPFWLVCLRMSVKNRHWAVALSTIGHALMLGNVIFSTGLFVLDGAEVTEERSDFVQNTTFRLPSNYDPANLQPGAWKNQTSDASAANVYYGIHFDGLNYPDGTSDDIVTPRLIAPNVPDILDYKTVTDGLRVKSNCEILNIPTSIILRSDHSSDNKTNEFYWETDIEVPGCSIMGASVADPLPGHDDEPVLPDTRTLQNMVEWYPCNLGFDIPRPGDWGRGEGDWDLNERRTILEDPSVDHRLALFITDMRFRPGAEYTSDHEYMYIHQATAVLCKPTYFIDLFEVQKTGSDQRGAVQAIPSAASNQQRTRLDGFSDGAMIEGVLVAIASWANPLSPPIDESAGTKAYPDENFFSLMSMRLNDSNPDIFFDSELVIDAATHVFDGVAAQYARQQVLQPDEVSLNGTITYRENRLQVTTLSTIAMCTSLGIISMISCAMIYISPRSCVAVRPGPVASMATVLASSPGLNEILSRVQTVGAGRTEEFLSDYGFRTTRSAAPATGIAIESSKVQTKLDEFQPTTAEHHSTNWWRPMASEPWFLVLAVASPLAVVAALEVVQHLSDKYSGIVAVSQNDTLAFGLYVPAAIMFGIASLYSGIELTVSKLSPFVAVRRGQVAAGHSINLDFVGKLLPRALYISIRSRHAAVTVALLANFIAGFLTIVSSGLYTAADATIVDHVRVYRSDSFLLDGEATNSWEFNAARVSSLIEYAGMDYSKWTHGNLAFPQLQMDLPASWTNSSNVRRELTATIPALRPRLNCSAVPLKQWIHSPEMDAEMMGKTRVFLNPSVTPTDTFLVSYTQLSSLDWCERPPAARNPELRTWAWRPQNHDALPLDGSTTYVGNIEVMDWVSAESIGVSVGFHDTLNPTGHGCPTMAINLGTQRMREPIRRGAGGVISDIEADLVTLLCYQHFEEVDVQATFTVPDFHVVKAELLDESSSRLLRTANGSARFDMEPYDLLLNLVMPELEDPIPGQTSNFFRALVRGKDRWALADLTGEANIENFAAAVDGLYGRYMAQGISLNMRVPVNGSSYARDSFEATVRSPAGRRFKQTHENKIALQVLLAIMAVCGVASRLLMPSKEVLPYNPHTIAGTAVLLAGSNMVANKMAVAEAEGESAGRRQTFAVPPGRVKYTMKWWQRSTDGDKRYGIDADPYDIF